MATSIVAPPNTSYKNQYDVFLNHSGPDVKKTLASHLYCRLDSQGFKVFLDKEEMQAGENLSCQIKGDIVTASVHVAIFSQTYAQSVWCLDELVLVLKSRVPILPVFYHVDSANLRRTSDKDRVRVYAEALRIHEKKRRHDPKIIKEWRKELSHVSNESGFELKECNGLEF